MDLKKLTNIELLDLRMKVNEAIELYKDRDKTKVFTVFIEFIGMKYFLEKQNAINYLSECIKEEMVFDGNEVKLHEKFLNDAEIENYCQDYKPKNAESQTVI
jgi:hypothetical protein